MRVIRKYNLGNYDSIDIELTMDTGRLSDDAHALGCAMAMAKDEFLKGERGETQEVTQLREVESDPRSKQAEVEAEPQEEVEQKVVKKKATRKKAAGKKKVTKKSSSAPKVVKDEIPKEEIAQFQQAFADHVPKSKSLKANRQLMTL